MESKRAQNIPELTGLRGVAALWVVAFHFQFAFAFCPKVYFEVFNHLWIKKGFLAVDFFFVLSGFVLSLSTAHWNGKNPFGFFAQFLRSRIARVYPLHFFGTVFMLTIFLVESSDEPFPWTALLSHFSMTHAWGNYYRPDLNYPSWSISAEWAAYLAFPVLFYAQKFVSKSKTALAISSVLSGAVLAWISINYKSGSFDLTFDWGWARCLTQFWIGMCLFNLRQSVIMSIGSRVKNVIAGVTLVALGFFITQLIPDFWVIPVGALTVFSVSLGSSIWKFILDNRVTRFLGEISYSIYMLHVPVGMGYLKLWATIGGANQSFSLALTALVSSVAVLLLASTATFYWIEIPLRKKIWGAPSTPRPMTSPEPDSAH